MAHLPETNLTKKFQAQAAQLEDNLFTLNELFQLCCDSSLSEDQLLKKASPLVEKLAKSNPEVAKELKEVLTSGDHSKIKAFFDKDIERRANL
ncbi:MAG: hypothetical protein H7A41_03740 [Chlamydiales bacterium]|nr:hypothetical protein [Chlamydiia bacterium]MCP5504247.1 hypothetical protein [Chlamydiales bacterium]